MRALAGYFIERRTALLNASRPDLASRIAAATSPENLDKLIGRYIPLESDRQSKPGTELLTQAAQRQEAFEKQAVLGSRGNRTELAPATTDPAAPPRPSASSAAEVSGEPSESDLYDVVNALLKQHAQGVRNLAESCDSDAARNDPASALLCLGGAAAQAGGAGEAMKITHFEKLGCAKASGKPGWTCDYMLATSGGINRALGPTMQNIMGQGGAAQARFLKTRDGWMGFFGEDKRD